MQISFSAQQIADVLEGAVEGDSSVLVNGFSKIEDAKAGSLTFLSNPKYTNYLYTTNASIVLLNNDFVLEKEVSPTLIRVPNAYTALAFLLEMVEKATKQKNVGIEANSFVADDAKLGKDVYIGAFAYVASKAVVGDNAQLYPQTYIGNNVEIGDNTILYPGVKIYANCKIGKNCIIHSGAIIGADGFGFAPDENGVYKKIPQMGNVVIEDDVEIGANTTIDKAVMDSTTIHRGVKLDNLIQIAHNVEIGEHTAIASQTAVAGSTKIGKNCMIGGQVGFGGHITIGDKTNVGAQSGIISNIEPGSKIVGSPAIPIRKFFRSSAVFAKLPEMYQQLGRLQKEMDLLNPKAEKNQEK